MKKAATLLRSRLALAAGAVLFSAAPALAQCAMCGTALQDADGPLQRGLFWSVVFLISLPYSIVAGFVGFLYWRHRQTRLEKRPALRLVTASGGNSIGGREVGR